MKISILSALTIATLTTGAQALESEKRLSIGAGQSNFGSESLTNGQIGFGGKFTLENGLTLGYSVDATLAQSTNKITTKKENIIGANVDVKAGYNVFKDLEMYGIVGYGYQAVASTNAGGIGFGGGIEYSISENIGVNVEYKSYEMELAGGTTYTSSSVSSNLIFKF